MRMWPVAGASLIVLLTFTACAKSDTPSLAGERIYSTTCMTCHQPEGQGIPNIYPPLAETEWVNGDKGRLIRIVLGGMRGPVVIEGVTYNNVMTSHSFLSDEQVAAVLSYVRSNFGNAAGAVSADEVAAVRAATNRRDLWTAEELESATGIPAQ